MVSIRDTYGISGASGVQGAGGFTRPGSILLENVRGIQNGVARYYTVSTTNGGFQFQTRSSQNMSEDPQIPVNFVGGVSELRSSVSEALVILDSGWNRPPRSLAAEIPRPILVALRDVLLSSNSTL